MILLVAGSRDITDKRMVWSFLSALHMAYGIHGVVTGGCRGVDELAEAWAVAHDAQVKTFSADWRRYGRAAGPIRNDEMASYVQKSRGRCLVIHRDTKGSLDMIASCQEAKLPCMSVRVW